MNLNTYDKEVLSQINKAIDLLLITTTDIIPEKCSEGVAELSKFLSEEAIKILSMRKEISNKYKQ